MLYPRSAEETLSEELFKNPSSEYRGAPFWAWNCALERDELLRQLDVLRQMGLGVTVRVPHLSWVSMKGEAKRDYPASIGYQSPWWKDYAYVEDHFARVCTALTRGKPVVRVGVIHPIESYWLHWGPEDQTSGVRQERDRQFQSLTQWLLMGSIDFDFISESLLPSLCPQGDAPLKVGEMAYDAIVVPACETLRSTTLARLKAFRQAGGRLIFLATRPSWRTPSPAGAAGRCGRRPRMRRSARRRFWRRFGTSGSSISATPTAPAPTTCSTSCAGTATACSFAAAHIAALR